MGSLLVVCTSDICVGRLMNMILEWKNILQILITLYLCCHINCDEKFCEKDFCQENGVKIYTELNDLDQYDPKVIEKLKNNILVPPSKGKLNLYRPPGPQSLKGQYGQPFGVEDVLKEKTVEKDQKKKTA